MEDVSTTIILFYCFSYSSQEKVENVSAVTILFLLLWIFKSRESEGRRAIAMLFTWIWVLKSRQSRGRLSYKGTFSIALDIQIKRMCRTSQLLPYFSIALGTRVKRTWRTSQLLTYFIGCSGYSSQEKVENVSAVSILFLLLWVFKSRENEGRLSYYNVFYMDFGTQVKRKWRTPQLLPCFFSNASGTQIKRK